MTLEADNVRVALTGAVYSAPTGTDVPTNPTDVWPDGWVDHGWISDGGVVEGYADQVKEIRAWQNGIVVRRMITGSDATFQFEMIETKGSNLELYHKSSQVEDLGGGVASLKVRPPGADRKMFGFDVIDGDEHVRIIVTDGEVTQRSNITYKSDSEIGYGVTITAYPVELDGDDFESVATKLSASAAWLEEIGS